MLVEIVHTDRHVVDGKQVRQRRESLYGFPAPQCGSHVCRFVVQGAAVLHQQRRGSVEIPHGEHACRRVVEVQAAHLQFRQQGDHVVHRIGNRQVQLFHHIRPVEQDPEVQRLRHGEHLIPDRPGEEESRLVYRRGLPESLE